MQIKVDREMSKCRRFLRDRIRPYVEEQVESCSVGVYVNPGEPQPCREFIDRAESGQIRFRPIEKGESWGTTWGTTWFRVEGVLPREELGTGTDFDLVADLGWSKNTSGGQCEGLVYDSDGRAIKGVQPFNSWVRLHGKGALEGLIDKDGRFRLYLEAGCNPMLLNIPQRSTDLGEEADGRVYSGYAYGGINLCRFDRELWEYARDLEVVTGLIEVLDKDTVRYWRVVKALQRSLNAYDDDNRDGTLASARAELAEVLDQTAGATTFHENAIGHAHIDAAYLWPKRETRRKIGRTVSNVLALMDQDDDFLFAMSSAQQYAWLEKDYPDLFKRMKERIDQGRFIPVGGMWVEADAMMPSGESLVRQITTGRKYFKEHLGVTPNGVWLPDSFGYSGALPQIARRAGYSWFLSQKISWNDTTKFPHHSFIWEGIDGSDILTHFPPTDTYAAEVTPNELRYSEVNACDKESIDQGLLLFGYGDGGGGPTREMLGRLSRMNDLEGIPTCRLSTPDVFFHELSKEMDQCDARERPRWHGELYLQLHRATLTSQQDMKAGCRHEEGLLRVMEYMGCRARLSNPDYRYPSDEIDAIWRRLLLNQFHDILPGSSIAWVHREAREDFDKDIRALKRMIQDAIEAIIDGVPESPLLESGRVSQANWRPHSVPSDQVKALDGSGNTNAGAPTVRMKDDTYILANDFVQATVGKDGRVLSCRDTKTGRELVVAGTGLGGYRILIDKPCERDAWEIDRDAFLGPCEYGKTTKVIPIGSATSSGVEVTTRIGSETTIVTRIVLDRGGHGLRFHAKVDWRERDRFLKVSFPLALRTSTATYECQYGTVDRPVYRDTEDTEAVFESCTHRFVYLHEGGYGLGLVNASTYGSSIFPLEQSGISGNQPGTLLELSLLSSPSFPDPNTDTGRIHEFTWELLPGANLDEVVQEASEINAPVLAHVPDIEPLIELRRQQGDVVLDWVKPADDGSSDIIVRLYEPIGERADAVIHASALLSKATVCETDLLEEDGETHGMPKALAGPDSEPTVPQGRETRIPLEGARLSLAPYQLTTLRIRP